MDIVEIARTAGMQVLLDARIGRETYHSVCGSLLSLQRFADAVCAAMTAELPVHGDYNEHREASALAMSAPDRPPDSGRRACPASLHGEMDGQVIAV